MGELFVGFYDILWPVRGFTERLIARNMFITFYYIVCSRFFLSYPIERISLCVFWVHNFMEINQDKLSRA